MQPHLNTEQRNLAGLTPSEQVALNTAGCMLLRELFGKTSSSLNVDWLAIDTPRKTAILTIARQPRDALMHATLSALPHQQREAIRLAVIALDYQKLFRCGCDTKAWHPAPTTRAIGDIERLKKERTKKMQMKHAVLAANQIVQSGPRAIGQ
ncbi:hypothetical protein [Aeromonas sp. sia0103]|uniref:hypothetical protein n=1 Tax=Aeromonas sp. sia0103 TaxID=2854782 RepID=UPI001C44333F|nr:hypothetical protein [Aeromonas sp. sia0103]MBV7598012.1 hypothetical protein [Aeromonas sp. sia0103]